MGCDIHLFTEIKRTVNGKEKWLNCDNWRLNQYYTPDNPEEGREYAVRSLYWDRCYTLFAVLADVRNNHDNQPIAAPRGLPPDVSPQVRAEADDWDVDGHSHSYFTLAELKEHARRIPRTNHAGLMSQSDADRVDRGLMPHSWCQGATKKDVVDKEWVMTGSPLNELIELVDERMRDEFWVYDKDPHPDLDEKIRVVFWFDN